MEILCGLAHEDGYCVILVTHDMGLLGYVDEVYQMQDGKFTKQ